MKESLLKKLCRLSPSRNLSFNALKDLSCLLPKYPITNYDASNFQKEYGDEIPFSKKENSREINPLINGIPFNELKKGLGITANNTEKSFDIIEYNILVPTNKELLGITVDSEPVLYTLSSQNRSRRFISKPKHKKNIWLEAI